MFQLTTVWFYSRIPIVCAQIWRLLSLTVQTNSYSWSNYLYLPSCTIVDLNPAFVAKHFVFKSNNQNTVKTAITNFAIDYFFVLHLLYWLTFISIFLPLSLSLSLYIYIYIYIYWRTKVSKFQQIKLIFFWSNRVLSFLVKHNAVKMAIIIYCLLPNFTAWKLCENKNWNPMIIYIYIYLYVCIKDVELFLDLIGKYDVYEKKSAQIMIFFKPENVL